MLPFLLDSSIVVRALVLGVTYKPNVPDARNSKSFDVIRALRRRGAQVDVVDPYADVLAGYVRDVYGERLMSVPPVGRQYHVVILSVGHKEFISLGPRWLHTLVEGGRGGFLADPWRALGCHPDLESSHGTDTEARRICPIHEPASMLGSRL